MGVARAVAGMLIVSAATVWAQSAPPVTESARRAPASRMVMAGPPENRMTSVQTALAEKRMQEMQDTLKKMHALLAQMRAKAASSGSKDAFAKADLEMWGLMLGHLDKQFEQVRIANKAHEDLNARRASLFKQAEAKAAAERAQAAMAAGTGAATGEQGTAAGSAGQAAAGATSTPASSTAK
jgi:hypothetical protein